MTPHDERLIEGEHRQLNKGTMLVLVEHGYPADFLTESEVKTIEHKVLAELTLIPFSIGIHLKESPASHLHTGFILAMAARKAGLRHGTIDPG